MVHMHKSDQNPLQGTVREAMSEVYVHQVEDEEVTKTYLLVHFPFAKTTNSILQLSSEGDRRSYQISHSVEVESSQIQTFWYADWLSCLQAPEFSNWG